MVCLDAATGEGLCAKLPMWRAVGAMRACRPCMCYGMHADRCLYTSSDTLLKRTFVASLFAFISLLPPPRRKKAPEFSDRVYDSTRSVPTPLERKLFNRCLARRRRLVREAARELISGYVGQHGRRANGVEVREAFPQEGRLAWFGLQGNTPIEPSASKLTFQPLLCVT